MEGLSVEEARAGDSGILRPFHRAFPGDDRFRPLPQLFHLLGDWS